MMGLTTYQPACEVPCQWRNHFIACQRRAVYLHEACVKLDFVRGDQQHKEQDAIEAWVTKLAAELVELRGKA